MAAAATAAAAVDAGKIKGIFLDNEAIHIEHMTAKFPNIISVKVPHTDRFLDIPRGRSPTPALEAYITSLGKNLYCDYFKGYSYRFLYDPVAGINPDILDNLKRAAAVFKPTLPAVPFHVLFDWDRTLTKFEGWIPLPSHILTNAMKEDMIIFLFGGRERLKLIRETISELVADRITVAILTNNVACNESIFTELVRAFHPLIQTIICGRFFEYNKPRALASSELFRKLSGGSRRTRRKYKKCGCKGRSRSISRKH